jgi:hypothetical protein
MGIVSDPTRNMNYLFDYGNITEENKAAALEIATYLESKGLDDIANSIKVKFKIVEIPKYDLESSPIVMALKTAGIFCAVQGYVQEGIEQDTIQYPLLSLNADIRHFEALIPIIKSMEVSNEGN